MIKDAGRAVSAPIPGPRLIVAIVASAILAFGFGAGDVEALRGSDIAGTIGDTPISVAEVDAAAGVGAVRVWGEIYRIVEAAAHGICVDRALQLLIKEAGVDLTTWKVGVWRQAEPSPAMVRGFVGANPKLFESVDIRDEKLIAHRLRVQRYRGRILAEAERVIGSDFHLLIGEIATTTLGEPRLGPIVGHCLDSTITSEQIEAYAAFPLYRRRAGLIASICRQFDIDHSNPLLLTRLARAEDMSPEELLRSKEANAPVPSADEVRELAERHYGDDDATSIAKARLALDTLHRGQARMDFLEELRRTTVGNCKLALPKAPLVNTRLNPGTPPNRLLQVHYFANFACQHCEQSWLLAKRLADERAGVIAIELRHHFPDTVAPLFDDAVAAECCVRQGRLWEYAEWRLRRGDSGVAGPDAMAAAIGLDREAFTACIADPRIAVKVLDDTEEALRLGFRGAVPSWVIGQRPRRGFQGEVVLDRTITEEAKSDG